MNITEFLDARIAEDEAREAGKFRIKTDRIDVYAIGPDYVDVRDKNGARERRITIPEFQDEYGEPTPDKRALAECAAKRAIIAEHDRMQGEPWQTWRHKYCATCADWEDEQLGEGPPNIEYPCLTLRSLAAVYKDHPDYQQEWALGTQ